jgi:DNA polymerase-3 subunit beta
MFETEDKQLITKVIDGKYPDYERVIPLTNDKLCLINRQELLRVVQRVAVIGIDKLKTIVLELKPNLITVSCRNEDQEESRDELGIQYGNDTELRLNFNISYILDVLNNIDEENLQWAFFDNQRSVLVTVPNQVDFKYVIMPLRT